RQLLALASLVKHTRSVASVASEAGYSDDWIRAISAYLAVCADRLADRNSCLGWWQTTGEKTGPTFTRWALPFTWDFAEICPWADISGGYLHAVNWVAEVDEHLMRREFAGTRAEVQCRSAAQGSESGFDIVVTD